MKLERILRYCEKMIAAETKHTTDLFASENLEGAKGKIEAYKNIMEFIGNADKAKESDYDKVKEIYQNHYSLHIQKMRQTRKAVVYNFTKKNERLVKETLIPLIKQEIGNNPDDYGEMEVGVFFDFFMHNIPKWWRENAFDISTLAKEDNFKRLCLQIATENNNKIYGTGDPKKATMSDVVSDLQLTKINMEEQ